MKTHHSFHHPFFCLTARLVPATLLGLLCFAAFTARGEGVPKFRPNPNAGPSDVIVVETFNQATGRIIRVLSRTNTQDDFIAWSVAGSIGLFEHKQVRGLFNIKRAFHIIDPLAGNLVNGNWTPPIDHKQIVNQVKAALDGSPTLWSTRCL